MARGLVKDKKTVKYVSVALAAAVVLVAVGVLALLSGGVDTVNGSEGASQQYAKKVYALRVDDLTDTAAVATLLEAMEMESFAGKYSVEIAPESEVYTLSLVAEKSVKADNKASFDAKMGEKAQQLLALIPQLGKVEWTYSLSSDGAKEKQENLENQASESIDTAGAGKLLGRDVREFGASQKAFEELLDLQAEKAD